MPPKRKRKGKGSWSPEARQKFQEMMKSRYGVDRSPLPSIEREKEFRERIQNQELNGIEEIEDMPKEKKFIAKRSFDYDTGRKFESGEIVEMIGLPNDDKLIRLGYVLEYTVSGREDQCIKCSKVFGSTSGYTMHVASHYDVCAVCDRKIPDRDWEKHMEAHKELAKV